jgi:hypothetical protein
MEQSNKDTESEYRRHNSKSIKNNKKYNNETKQTLDLLLCQSLVAVFVSSRVFGLFNLLIRLGNDRGMPNRSRHNPRVWSIQEHL